VSTTVHTYTVSFATPAFLGNAEQQAQWRTPPIKALLRQWWRVANAKGVDFDVGRLAEEEGKLFGTASDEKAKSCRSKVQIRLSRWTDGTLTTWEGEKPVHHREVSFNNGNIGAHAYLGFGPLDARGGTKLATNENGELRRALRAQKDKSELTLRFPEGNLEPVLQLVSWFGTVGGRSRNGWGSLHLEPRNGTPAIPELTTAALQAEGVLHDWRKCLSLEWPHAIGQDDKGPLVWLGKKGSWSDAMRELADIKIAFRTQKELQFNKNRDYARPIPERRHVIAYPVTNHGVLGWGRKDDRRRRILQDERLANQLRFKVNQIKENYRCTIVHVPCRVPKYLLDKLSNDDRRALEGSIQEEVWGAVHKVLDEHPALQRLS
jgi:CRISPR-associated protein Cmr1